MPLVKGMSLPKPCGWWVPGASPARTWVQQGGCCQRWHQPLAEGSSLAVDLPLTLSVQGKKPFLAAGGLCGSHWAGLLGRAGTSDNTAGVGLSLWLNPWSRGPGAAASLVWLPHCNSVFIPGTADASPSLCGGSACTQLGLLPSEGTFHLLTAHVGRRTRRAGAGVGAGAVREAQSNLPRPKLGSAAQTLSMAEFRKRAWMQVQCVVVE